MTGKGKRKKRKEGSEGEGGRGAVTGEMTKGGDKGTKFDARRVEKPRVLS